MQEFGVKVIDHLSLLSKNQTLRLKQAVKNSFTDKIYKSIDAKIRFQTKLYKEIIPSIQYSPTSELKYDHAEVQWDADQKLCTIELLFKQTKNTDEEKKVDNLLKENDKDARSKIRQLLYEKNKTRQSSTKSNDTDQWKTYTQLKTISGRQDIPSPSDIHANRTMYEEVIKSLPNSPIKNYFEKCL